MATHKYNRFEQGSGLFTCQLCKKKTRNTGDNAGAELCPLCYEKALYGNGLSDAGYKPALPDGPDAWAVLEPARTVDEVHTIYNREMKRIESADSH